MRLLAAPPQSETICTERQSSPTAMSNTATRHDWLRQLRWVGLFYVSALDRSSRDLSKGCRVFYTPHLDRLPRDLSKGAWLLQPWIWDFTPLDRLPRDLYKGPGWSPSVEGACVHCSPPTPPGEASLCPSRVSYAWGGGTHRASRGTWNHPPSTRPLDRSSGDLSKALALVLSPP